MICTAGEVKEGREERRTRNCSELTTGRIEGEGKSWWREELEEWSEL
jgi:hypothetical protein